MEEEPIRKSDEECAQLLQLIIDGYPDFLKTILPDGWKKSEYVNFFHPTAEQQFEEHKRFSENLKHLKKDKTEDEEEKKISLSDFTQDFSDMDIEHETIYLLGLCLWDIFSDNHSVITDDGSEYDIGSWRGSGRFISGLLNDYGEKRGVKERFDYISFYMGTIWIQGRSNLLPFYEFIFSILKKQNCNWKYSFPQLGIISFDNEEEQKPEDYNPAKALEGELKKKETEKLNKEFDDDYNEKYEEANYKKPPPTVLAYQKNLC